MNIPGFTAEASLDRSSSHFQGDVRATVLVHPAARPIFYRSMKGFCVDLRVLGIPRVCCNGDECGTDVLI